MGAGNMGHGIARTCAVHGFAVVMTDKYEKPLQTGINEIEMELKRYFLDKGRMTEPQIEEVLDRLQGTTCLEDAVNGADLVIESIYEDLEIKKTAFTKLDNLCAPDTILASNTSQLSIGSIASATNRPDKVIGMHFFNPPDVNPLLEVVPGLLTSEETLNQVMVLSEKLGKHAIQVKDTPAFVVNRFINVIYSEAARTVQNGIATAEQIDVGVKMGLGFRMGPCEMMDYSGLELVADAMSKNAQCSDIYLLGKMVDAGKYGRKNGHGFYDYQPDGTKTAANLSRIAGT